MSTKIEAPPPRNLAQETGETLATQIRLAPEQLRAYQETAPGYLETDLGLMNQALRSPGGIFDLNRELTQQAADQSLAANRQQRQADLADLQSLGPQLFQMQRELNPELYQSMDAFGAAAQNGVGRTGFADQAAKVAQGGFGSFTPERVAGIGNGNTVSASNQPGNLQRMLEQQAEEELALGGQLSTQEARDAQQAARAAYASRGLGSTNSSIAAEVLNLDSASRARRRDRQGFAASVDSQGFGQRQLGAELGLRAGLANQQDALARAGLNAQIGQFNAGMGLESANFNRQGQLAQFGALSSLDEQERQRQLGNIGLLGSLVGMRQATQFDPALGVLGRQSVNQGTNAGLFGQGAGVTGGAQATRGMFDPFNGYASDLNSMNYNADLNARIATGNNKAALIGAGIGAVGAIGGGLFGAR